MRRHELGQVLAEHMSTFLPTPLQAIVVAYLCDGSDSFGAAHSIPDILASEVIRDSKAATEWHAQAAPFVAQLAGAPLLEKSWAFLTVERAEIKIACALVSDSSG
jgi:hypothetical protein